MSAIEVKICGVRSDGAALACRDAAVDFAGLNFVADTRRAISTELAARLVGLLGGTTAVAVFRDADAARIQAVTAATGIRWVQLHGDETPDLGARLAGGLRVIRALSPADLADPARIAAWAAVASRFLVDGREPGAGLVWDWDLPGVVDGHLHGIPVWLAGGLRPSNVADAIARVSPAGVDVASGIEFDGQPGPALIRAFTHEAGRMSVQPQPSPATTPTSGRFGRYGGRYVSELLVPALDELEAAWLAARVDPDFRARLGTLLADYAGRPTPLYRSVALSQRVGCEVFLKREDLVHGGAHKTNNTLAQALLAVRMGKQHLIAETGAGQHGVATAMAGALLGLDVKIFMGAKDVARQQPNVRRMQLFGATVEAVEAGSRSLKDAINETLRYWTEHVAECFYVFGTVAGPHPYPSLVRDFQRVIGEEIRAQLLDRAGRLPTAVYACVGGGSNAIGAFAAFLEDATVALVGVEPAGEGIATGHHGATLGEGRPGCLHGSISYVLQDDDGQIQEAHSISAGLDYPGVGPEHAWLKDTGRARYTAATDADALAAFAWVARHEGILPALESSHALAALFAEADRYASDDVVVVNLSGRGDKDLEHAIAALDASAVSTEAVVGRGGSQ